VDVLAIVGESESDAERAPRSDAQELGRPHDSADPRGVPRLRLGLRLYYHGLYRLVWFEKL